MKNYFYLIQDYLDGALSTEEQQDFEQALSVDKELLRATDMQKQIAETIQARINAAKGLDAAKETIALTSRKYFAKNGATPKAGKVIKLRALFVAVGVAACVLLALGYLGVFSPSLTSLPTLQTEVTRGADNHQNVEAAISAFNNKEYKKSVQLFSAMCKENTTTVRFKYYLGLSYLGEKNWDSTIAILQPIADGVSLYQVQAAYFVAVAAYQAQHILLAKTYAQKVPKNSIYYKKAQRLLRKLQ